MNATMSDARRNREKRGMARHPTRIRARMWLPNDTNIPVEIADYCHGGLFVKLGNANRHAELLQPGDTLSVSIPARESPNGEVRIVGRVAHRSEAGVGMQASGMTHQAILALDRLTAEIDETRGHPIVKPENADAILRTCHEHARRALRDILSDYFPRLLRHLANARDLAYFMEQQRYELASRTLQVHRHTIENALLETTESCLDSIEQGHECVMHEDPVEEGELTLVEDAALENWLALTGVISQIEAGMQGELVTLQVGYGALLGKPMTRKTLPFGPEILCRQLGKVLADIDLHADCRQVAYKAFGETLRARLPPLFDILIELLSPVARSVHSRIVQSPSPGPDAETARATRDRGTRDPADTEGDWPHDEMPEVEALLRKLLQEQTPSRLDADTARSDTSNALYSLRGILSALNRPSRADPKHDQEPIVSFDEARGVNWSSRGDIASLINTAQRLNHAYRQLAKHHPPGAGNFLQSADRPPSESERAGRTEILDFIDAIPSGEDTEGKPQRLSDRLAPRIGAIPEQALPPTQRATLDTMARLLDQVAAEHTGQSQIEPLLSKLEKPILGVALSDPSFLGNAQHPAKRLISLLDQYAIATDDSGRFYDANLRNFLSTLLERVSARARLDPSVYVTAGAYMERMLQPIRQARRRRVALLQETCEAKERVKTARSRTREMLEEMLGGRDIPVVLIRLIELGWLQYMSLLELRRGVNHPDWHHGRAVLGMLLGWLGAYGNKPLPSNQTLAETIAYLETHLSTVNTEPLLLRKALEQLWIDLRQRTQGLPVTLRRIEAGRFNPHREARPVSGPHDDLMVGQWWRFEDSSQPRIMQLIWMSQPEGQCALTNRSASGKVEFSLEDFLRRLEDGTIVPTDDKDQPLFERSAQIVVDEAYRHLSHEVSHDTVTGLINRKGFMQRLQQITARHDENTHYICILEFDQFRVIYNNCGAEAGESLTRTLATEIQAFIGHDHVLAAFQDDMFALLVYQHNRIQVLEFANRLLKRFENFRFDHGNERYSIGVNIGLAEFVAMHSTPEEAIRNADAACQIAAQAGRNRVQRYDAGNELLRAQQNLMHWAGRIDQIIQQNGLYLRCQKVEPLDPASGHIPYYEILLGIRPDKDDIPAPKFLSAVERWQRGPDIDMWVVEKTFAWVEENLEWFTRMGGFAINIVPASMAHPEFLKFLQAKLDTAALPLDKIIFEITETSAIDNQRAAQEFIRQIRRYGCRFSVDDLGSGYSSFAHLKNLRTNSIKIDGIFVRDCVDTPSDFAMVRSMNDIGHALGLVTVAEFVESAEIMEKLRAIGVDYAQGYAVKKPVRLDELVALIEQEEKALVESMHEASENGDPRGESGLAGHYTWHNDARVQRDLPHSGNAPMPQPTSPSPDTD